SRIVAKLVRDGNGVAGSALLGGEEKPVGLFAIAGAIVENRRAHSGVGVVDSVGQPLQRVIRVIDGDGRGTACADTQKKFAFSDRRIGTIKTLGDTLFRAGQAIDLKRVDAGRGIARPRGGE